MVLPEFLEKAVEGLLFFICLFLLGGGLYLTVKMRFIQFRLLPLLYKQKDKLFSQKKTTTGEYTISPMRALLTAMSTTLGISTIVGPVIAIRLGGPGALLGFLLASFLGSAITYVEVTLSVRYRRRLESGRVMGGAMQYMKEILSPKAAKFYAICGTVLLMGWSAAQANQLTAILDSPMLGTYRIPALYSGLFLVALVTLALRGGVKRIGAYSAKLVPIMFCLYIGSSLWIIGSNFDRMLWVLQEVFSSAFTPYALASGSCVGGIVSALRWGVFKGVQVTEAGVGTQTIPHSMAETTDGQMQGALAMLSTFSAGGLAFLSGCVALLTNTWQDPGLPLGMAMVSASYAQYFSALGVVIVAVSAFLFGFGTILGNSFNGEQCYRYLTENRKKRFYFLGMMTMIFLGSIGEAKVVWSLVDVLLAFIVVPHMIALIVGVRRSPELFLLKKLRAIEIKG